jgi:hypothetical protein
VIRRRALAAGVEVPIGCHSWRAIGITTYLENGGSLERALSTPSRRPSTPTASPPPDTTQTDRKLL